MNVSCCRGEKEMRNCIVTTISLLVHDPLAEQGTKPNGITLVVINGRDLGVANKVKHLHIQRKIDAPKMVNNPLVVPGGVFSDRCPAIALCWLFASERLPDAIDGA